MTKLQPTHKTKLSYEEAQQELEKLLNQLENPDTKLDDLLKLYERGLFLVQYCRDQLNTVEQQMLVFEKNQLNPLLENNPEIPQ